MGDVINISSDDEEIQKNGEKMKLKDVKRSKPGRDKRKEGDSDLMLYTFKKFLALCQGVEVNRRNGDPLSITRINDKLLARFTSADPEYTKSEVFRETLASASKLVETDPSNLFVHMKHVGDELKVKSKKEVTRKRKLSDSGGEGRHESEENHTGVNLRHLHKLEMIFEKVYRKVKHLEEKEVDFDAEEDSSYLKLERYKKRLYTIWEKWQEVRGRTDEVKKLKHRKIAFSGTQHSEVNYAIEKFVNKTKGFPDYLDVYNVTEEALNKEKSGKYSTDHIREVASAAFQTLGNQLQKMRVYDFWNSCQTYLPAAAPNIDPADEDETLAKALKENEVTYKKKLCEVINNFVDKQIDGKFEPEEVLPGVAASDSSEEEEEEEDPEEIVEISSSSEEIVVEEQSEEELVNGIFKSNANGNMDESSSHSGTCDSKASTGKLKSGKERREADSSREVTPSKQKKLCEEKATTSCSSLHSEKREKSSSDCGNNKGHGKIESAGTNGAKEIVILSESDSGE